jgi:hypothetical protein
LGAAAALYGSDPFSVGDVDLLVDRDCAERLSARLGVMFAPGSPSARFRSDLFGRWCDPPLPVEIMAGFHVRAADRWTEVRPFTRERIEVEGSAVYVPLRAELAAMLRLFGRPGDLTRADLLLIER